MESLIYNNIFYFLENYNLDEILKKIFDKINIGKQSYVSKERIEEFINENTQNEENNLVKLNSKNILQIDEFENKFIIYLTYPNITLKDINENKSLSIKYLIKVKFVNEENDLFESWICSNEFLLEKIKYMGYKEAKIGITKIFSEKQKEENNSNKSNSNSPSTESIDFSINIEKELISEKFIYLKKEFFNLDNIFKKSKNFFAFKNQMCKNNPLNEINQYKNDLNITDFVNKKNFKCNTNYINDLDFLNFKKGLNYYLYNMKSGTTFSIFQHFENIRIIHNIKYFYCNCQLLINDLKFKKKYIAFQIAKLFDDEQKFKNFFNNVSNDISQKNFENLLKNIISNFNNIYIIFDNILTEKTLDIVNELFTKIKFRDNIFFVFIQFNLPILRIVIRDNSNRNFEMLKIKSKSYNEKYTPEYYFDINNSVKKIEKENEILNQIKKNFLSIFDAYKNNIEFSLLIIKLTRFSYFKEKKFFLNYEEIKYLNILFDYFYFYSSKGLNEISFNNIKFRNYEYKKFFKKYINLVFCNYLNNNEINSIINDIKNKSTEGIYLEKQIIFFLIFRYLNYKQINIKQIYCFNPDANFDINNENNEEFFFYQEYEYAPLYDFAILKNYNNKITLKVYQIGINKPPSALIKLNKNKIIIDLLFFISKLNKKLTNKISIFTFGIITTKNAYDKNQSNIITKTNEKITENEYDNNDEYDDIIEEEYDKNLYKNYENMKKFCQKNNFEFLIFDSITNEFNIEKDGKLIDINFNTYINDNFCNDLNNYLFKNENSLNPIKKIPISKELKNSINIIKQILQKYNINIKKCDFIAKFNFKENNVNFSELVNSNYLLYQKPSLDDDNFTVYFKGKNLNGKFKISQDLFVFNIISNNLMFNNENIIKMNKNKNDLLGIKRRSDNK